MESPGKCGEELGVCRESIVRLRWELKKKFIAKKNHSPPRFKWSAPKLKHTR